MLALKPSLTLIRTHTRACRVLTAYNVALGRATKLMRQLLRQCGGYECKEPEAGKLTLAFR